MGFLALLIVLVIAFVLVGLVIQALKWLLILAVVLAAIGIAQGWSSRSRR